MTNPKDRVHGQELKAITVRLVRDDYQRLQSYADARNTSLNAVVTEAIAEYGRKIERRDALESIAALRERVGPATTGSVALIRELRNGRASRLAGEGGPVRKGDRKR